MSSKRELKDDEVVIAKLSDALKATNRVGMAFINFDGTGTPTINDSHIYDSITDNGAGDWTPAASGAELGGGTANYAVSVSAVSAAVTQPNVWAAALKGTNTGGPTNKTSSSTQVVYGGNSLTDAADVSIIATWSV